MEGKEILAVCRVPRGPVVADLAFKHAGGVGRVTDEQTEAWQKHSDNLQCSSHCPLWRESPVRGLHAKLVAINRMIGTSEMLE